MTRRIRRQQIAEETDWTITLHIPAGAIKRLVREYRWHIMAAFVLVGAIEVGRLLITRAGFADVVSAVIGFGLPCLVYGAWLLFGIRAERLRAARRAVARPVKINWE